LGEPFIVSFSSRGLESPGFSRGRNAV